jgi:hypothetical protein
VTPAEVSRFAEEVPERYKALILTAATAGFVSPS